MTITKASQTERLGHHVVGRITPRPVVVGTGLVALDVVYGLNRECGPGIYAGGTCGNVLAGLAFLGWDCVPVARIGGDAAGTRVREDLRACGVRLDHAQLRPQARTPVMVQWLRLDSKSRVVHRFSNKCPQCGDWLPQYQAVTRASIDEALSTLPNPDVLFVDRVSAGAVRLAEAAHEQGALVYFEPSARCPGRLFEAMLAVTDVLKYSRERAHYFAEERPRLASLPLEIETLGRDGLRYRGTMFGKAERSWRSLPAFGVPQLRDAAGAGDWATIGLLDFLGRGGREGFQGLPRDLVVDGLRQGQGFAAWTCGFEGARGGMYRQDTATVQRAVSRILERGAADEDDDAALCETPYDVFSELCGVCTPKQAKGKRA